LTSKQQREPPVTTVNHLTGGDPDDRLGWSALQQLTTTSFVSGSVSQHMASADVANGRVTIASLTSMDCSREAKARSSAAEKRTEEAREMTPTTTTVTAETRAVTAKIEAAARNTPTHKAVAANPSQQTKKRAEQERGAAGAPTKGGREKGKRCRGGV